MLTSKSGNFLAHTSQECLLGADFLSQNKCMVDLKHQNLIVDWIVVSLQESQRTNQRPTISHDQTNRYDTRGQHWFHRGFKTISSVPSAT